MSALHVLTQARELARDHSRLIAWWLLAGFSRALLWLLPTLVAAAAVLHPADGWGADPLAAALHALDRLAAAALTATTPQALAITGLLTVTATLSLALAAFFDAGFFGYIARCVTADGPRDRGGWRLLCAEALRRWLPMLGWTARRLSTRAVLFGCLALLAALLLQGPSPDTAPLWAVAAVAASALGAGLWWWRVRALRFMLRDGVSVGRGLRAAAAEVGHRGLGSLVIGPGDVLLFWAAPAALTLLLLGALAGLARPVAPALSVSLAVTLDLCFLCLFAFTDALLSGALMSNPADAPASDKHTPWLPPLPAASPHIFRISDVLRAPEPAPEPAEPAPPADADAPAPEPAAPEDAPAPLERP